MRLVRSILRLSGLLLASAALVPLAVLLRLLGLLGLRARGLRGTAWLQSFWGRIALAAMGVRLDVAGRPPPGRYVVVSNHLSYVDIPVLSVLFPGRFVAKSEIAGWPVLGFFSRVAGTLFVDQTRRRDVVRVGEEIEETLAAGVRVVLFPEGGASRGLRVERVHSALLEPAVKRGVPCLPVALSYDTPGEPWAPAASVCWWGGMAFWRHFVRLLALDGIRARVRWAREPLTAPDRKELARRLGTELDTLFEPVRQSPLPPDFPWPEVFELPAGERVAR